MYPLVKQSHTSVTYFSRLLNNCFSLKSLTLAQSVHSQLIKVGFHRHTFLGNRCLELYSKFGSVCDVFKVFDELGNKNVISWNLFLKGMLHFEQCGMACYVFDEMPERDVVSWNTMISGFISCGDFDFAWRLFWEMQSLGLRPNGFTYSILSSVVSAGFHGKELHGSIVRAGLSVSNVLLGNCLIDMYGKLGFVDYAFGVFLTMEELDVISWNSIITGCCKSGYGELALNQFYMMRSSGYSPDEYTCSAVITCCSHLRNLNKGEQIFVHCVKAGFLCNTIVSSAVIDLFSKCNRLEDSVQLFQKLDQWDPALCSSMISSYSWHGFGEDAFRLFVNTLKECIRPTEFMLSSVLSSISIHLAEQGTLVHSLAIKSGLEEDAIVASSLVNMYANCGFVNCSTKIFDKMLVRDLISWNSMIIGLTNNGSVCEALCTFKELLWRGPPPDRITLAGVLLACNHGGFIDEGTTIFASMEETYGITPNNEHCACLVDSLCQADRFHEATCVTEAMPYDLGSIIWRSLLCASATRGDLKLAETAAKRLMELEPKSSLPYVVLGRIYEMRGQWEAVVRVRKAMERERVKKVTGCSYIGLRNCVYAFKADQLQHHGGKNIYWALQLLNWEVDDEGCFHP